MKKLISNYTFNPAARTISFADYTSIDLEGLLLITNVTNNQIIYNFADPCFGGGVSGNTVTLAYDTTAMSSSDALQIYYDDSNSNPATYEAQIQLEGVTQALYELINRLEFLTSVRGSAADLRTSVVNTPAVTIGSGTVTTVNAVTTVGTVGTVSTLNTLNTNTVVKDFDNLLALSNINNIIT